MNIHIFLKLVLKRKEMDNKINNYIYTDRREFKEEKIDSLFQETLKGK